ncbi:Rho GTPase activating protein [Taxawa tesnikishii (nom. ined.)]|nr:Rho GTPase activating protein [Dothideales sp. JES 119]
MTVRNVGIVFAPTLNIPGPLISLFISDFGTIFGPPLDIDVSASPVLQQESHNAAFAPSDSIRSPRKQMFTDLPTPAYHQTTFNPAQPYGPYQAQVMAARNAYDTGFIPMQQTYEQSARPSAAPAQHQGGYGSLNDALAAPTNGHNASGPALSRAEKQARRESAFLVAPTAGLTQARKGSLQQLRENANGF